MRDCETFGRCATCPDIINLLSEADAIDTLQSAISQDETMSDDRKMRESHENEALLNDVTDKADFLSKTCEGPLTATAAHHGASYLIRICSSPFVLDALTQQQVAYVVRTSATDQ